MSHHYKPKIYVLSASIGNGHMQAARAVAEALKRHPSGYRAQTLDFLSRDIVSLDYWVRETYIKIIDLFPLIYDLLYHQSQSGSRGKQVRNLSARLFRQRMEHLIGVLKPDGLVFTHPFPAAAADRLREKGRIRMPLVGVITDFDAHQLWAYRNLDAFCVPTNKVAERLAKQGVDRKIIYATGIPIRHRFYEVAEEEYAREPGTVLIMGGGLGLGALKDILWRLTQVDSITRFIVVTGHNVSLYDEIEDMRGDLRVPLELYGFTNFIPQLMARSSLLVTKPGALTCTEAMTMHLPMLLVDPIPGQEEANAEYMEQIGCAKWISREELVPMVRTFFAEKNQPLCKSLSQPQHSAKIIADIIHKLVKERN